MKYLKALLPISLLALTTILASAESPAKKPYELNASYVIAFSPIASQVGVELPTGPITVIDEAGDWIRIQYSISRNERSKSDSSKVEAVETVYKAWINLEHVAALVESTKAK